MSPSDQERVFTEQEAALLLKMTRRMLADRRREGKIRYLKDGHFISYKMVHIAEYLASVEKGMDIDLHLSASRLLEAVQEHLARSDRRRKKHTC